MNLTPPGTSGKLSNLARLFLPPPGEWTYEKATKQQTNQNAPITTLNAAIPPRLQFSKSNAFFIVPPLCNLKNLLSTGL